MGWRFYKFLKAALVFSFLSSAESAWPAGPEVACRVSEISMMLRSVKVLFIRTWSISSPINPLL